MRLSARLLAASALALSFAAPALAQDAATIQRASDDPRRRDEQNIALDYVTQLTTRFGARPAGSKSEQDAAAWAAGYMRAQGFQNVRIETFPLVGWERGEESASIVGDRPQRLVVAALGHSPGTNGVIEAEVVRFDSLEALNAAPGRVAGGQDRLYRRRPDGPDAGRRRLWPADPHPGRRSWRGGGQGRGRLHHALGRLGRSPDAAHRHHPLRRRPRAPAGLRAQRAGRQPAVAPDRHGPDGAAAPVLDRPHL
jgi:hypothetical protein